MFLVTPAAVIILGTIALATIAGMFTYIYEKKVWNKGTCTACNTPWHAFDMDSQGGTGIVCGCPGTHREWVSYITVPT